MNGLVAVLTDHDNSSLRAINNMNISIFKSVHLPYMHVYVAVLSHYTFSHGTPPNCICGGVVYFGRGLYFAFARVSNSRLAWGWSV